MIALYLLILLVWTGLCVGAGRIYQMKKDERDDLNARDEWANKIEQGAA